MTMTEKEIRAALVDAIAEHRSRTMDADQVADLVGYGPPEGGYLDQWSTEELATEYQQLGLDEDGGRERLHQALSMGWERRPYRCSVVVEVPVQHGEDELTRRERISDAARAAVDGGTDWHIEAPMKIAVREMWATSGHMDFTKHDAASEDTPLYYNRPAAVLNARAHGERLYSVYITVDRVDLVEQTARQQKASSPACRRCGRRS